MELTSRERYWKGVSYQITVLDVAITPEKWFTDSSYIGSGVRLTGIIGTDLAGILQNGGDFYYER